MVLKRRKTREVMVGGIGIGGDNPVRIQSMTTSDTRDVEKTVEQVLKLQDHGCEIVRMTVQGIKEAEACAQIKEALLKKGCKIPLVADIHFYPPAAMRVVEFVDKVRINPGNFADKRATFKELAYTPESYQDELKRIEEKFAPLVIKCKELKKALRIGTNHGSLSDRIMSHFGDTPKGMVESALEFARICRKYDFHDFIFSMKASNPQVMTHAYRLLVEEMDALGWDYPLHLGVTEAGEGEDGRIKSAVGIGSLLLDGIGDTVRVSLTEDPWFEIDPCQRLKNFAASYQGNSQPDLKVRKHHKKVDTVEAPLHRDGSVFLFAPKLASADFYADAFGKKGALPPIDAAITSGSHPHEKTISMTDALYIQDEGDWEQKKSALKDTKVILLNPQKERLTTSRSFFSFLEKEGIKTPVLIAFSYTASAEDFVIAASSEAGPFLMEGLAQGLALQGPYPTLFLRSFSFNLLQACRLRSSKTEYISCPGCGRTLFNLQEVTKRIHAKTGHLPGVKIAVMGCIVNGPGEMADADFGYVGSKTGMVDLYIGKECVQRDIPFDQADDRLVQLIKDHGRWLDPVASDAS